jgi:hypothetical protein
VEHYAYPGFMSDIVRTIVAIGTAYPGAAMIEGEVTNTLANPGIPVDQMATWTAEHKLEQLVNMVYACGVPVTPNLFLAGVTEVNLRVSNFSIDAYFWFSLGGMDVGWYLPGSEVMMTAQKIDTIVEKSSIALMAASDVKMQSLGRFKHTIRESLWSKVTNSILKDWLPREVLRSDVTTYRTIAPFWTIPFVHMPLQYTEYANKMLQVTDIYRDARPLFRGESMVGDHFYDNVKAYRFQWPATEEDYKNMLYHLSMIRGLIWADHNGVNPLNSIMYNAAGDVLLATGSSLTSAIIILESQIKGIVPNFVAIVNDAISPLPAPCTFPFINENNERIAWSFSYDAARILKRSAVCTLWTRSGLALVGGQLGKSDIVEDTMFSDFY